MTEIHVMRLSIGIAVTSEFAVLDRDVAPGDAALENTFLIVVEIAVPDSPVRALRANSRAVLRTGYGTGEFDVFDDNASGNHPNALILRASPVCVDVSAPIYALNRQIILRKCANIAV